MNKDRPFCNVHDVPNAQFREENTIPGVITGGCVDRVRRKRSAAFASDPLKGVSY